jgi:hypothetical protein
MWRVYVGEGCVEQQQWVLAVSVTTRMCVPVWPCGKWRTRVWSVTHTCALKNPPAGERFVLVTPLSCEQLCCIPCTYLGQVLAEHPQLDPLPLLAGPLPQRQGAAQCLEQRRLAGTIGT